MATSSITHNFFITDPEAAKRFANAVEESYQESLHRKPKKTVNVSFLESEDEIIEFLAKRDKRNA